MTTANELRTIQAKVKKLMEDIPETRVSDRILVSWYYSVYHDIDTATASFESVIMDKTLPPISSIERQARIVRAEHPELTVQKVQEARINNEMPHIEVALESSCR